MKKFGFTLAEVLITLGIIGVVAALTAPALVQNAGSAQIGPKLAKAVSTFELACENMLNEQGASTLRASGAFDGQYDSSGANLIDKLSNYMKISYMNQNNSSNKYESMVTNYDGSPLTNEAYAGLSVEYAIKDIGITKDGMLYGIEVNAEVGDTLNRMLALGNGTPAPNHILHHGTVIIDINGKSKPNRLGKDIFVFDLKADGSLAPVGSQKWSMFVVESDDYKWNTGSNPCNETSVGTGLTCAGSIFENNLKVIYQ